MPIQFTVFMTALRIRWPDWSADARHDFGRTRNSTYPSYAEYIWSALLSRPTHARNQTCDLFAMFAICQY